MKRGTRLILLTSILLVLASFVQAFGVATPYFEGNELLLYPGETVTIELTLQNMVGNKDLRFIASVPETSAALLQLKDTDPTYLVELGRDDVKVPLIISIPETTTLGEANLVEVSFIQTDVSNKGTVAFGTGFNTQIPIKIVSEEESTFYVEEIKNGLTQEGLFTIIGAILILLIIIDMTRKVHHNKRRKKRQKKHKKKRLVKKRHH